MGNKPEMNRNLFDIRQKKPRIIRDLGKKETFTLKENREIPYGKSDLSFWLPNLPGVLLHSYRKSLKEAKEIHLNTIKPLQSQKGMKALDEKETINLYNYLEQIQLSIILICTTIESVVNSIIPSDYEYKEKDKEYDYWNIQRKLSIEIKLKKVLPAALNIKKVSQEKYWSKFIELLRIRHDIIHMKSTETNTTYNQRDITNKENKLLIEHLIDDKIFSYVKSGYKILEFLHQEKNIRKLDFPLLSMKEKLEVETYDNLEEHFTQKEQTHESSSS